MIAAFFAFVLVGALIGFLYSWFKTAGNTARNIASVMELPIDPADKAARRVRAKTVGRIRGLQIGASAFMGALGAACGLTVWVIWQAVAWLA